MASKPQVQLSTPQIIAQFIQSANRSQVTLSGPVIKRKPLIEWAYERRNVDGKPFSLDRYPFLREIYADEHHTIALPKAAQMGLSEFGINRALWALDEYGMDILYLLPTDDEAYDFSNARFGAAIESSDYLEALFDDVANTQHKRAGERNFFIRGSKSRSKLKSMPIDFLVVDEYDEMVQRNLPMARRRLDASPYKWELDISTPTVPEYGIHARWLESDQREWEVKCPRCNKLQIPTWPDNINLEVSPAQYWCSSCHGTTNSFVMWNGVWVPGNPGADIHGYQITQLLSPMKTAENMAKEWVKAEEDPAAEQEFWNQGMGRPHVAKGGALDDDLLRACRDPGYPEMPGSGKRCSMGVDVGKVLHVRISVKEKDKKRAVYIDTVQEFEDLDTLMAKYDVGCCVIDALPETRKSMEFCQRFAGRAYAARYDIQDKAEAARWDPDKRIVHLNRTIAMDKVMARVVNRNLILPTHAQTIPNYFQQMKAPKRILVTDKNNGTQVYRYVDSARADHFAHAELYDEMAFERAGMVRDFSGMSLNLDSGKRESVWKP